MKYPDMTWGTMEAVVNKLGGMEAVQRFLSSELIVQAGKSVAQAASNLLRFVTIVSVPAVKRFIAGERFVSSDTIKFNLGGNFKTHFLSKVEENVPPTTLTIHTLTRNAPDKDIREELTPQREEITLAHFYKLISRQPKGEQGILLTDGNTTLCHIKDAEGTFWTISTYWYADGGEWLIGACSVTYPSEWYEGNRVVSR